MKRVLLITCEHASPKIPKNLEPLFKGSLAILKTHQGYDIGAESCFEQIIKKVPCQSIKGEWSRLVVDLNRSLHHPKLFSAFTKELSNKQKEDVIQQYYHPHRKKIQQLINPHPKKGTQVVHLAIHSFTPILHGQKREADIGLLYDPSRRAEKDFSKSLKHFLQEKTDYHIRMNYPYKGTSDGLTTYLRSVYKNRHYLGIEIELNQKHLLNKKNINAMMNPLIQFLLALSNSQK